MMRNIAVVLSGRDAGLARTLGAAAGAIRTFDQQVTGMGTRGAKAMAGLKFALQAIGVAAAVALGASVVAAVRFEGAMRNVNTITQLGQQQFRAMSAAVLELSTRLPQSATTLAKGLYDIVSSGFEAGDALKILEVSATAASAGITDTATASRTIVGVLNAYGLEAEDAAYVSDVLFKTVELGVITFEQLANELGEVNAGAAAANISIEEVGGALATMTLSGLNASEATTSLNRLIREFISPNDELAEALRKVGIESATTAFEEEGLHGVMEKLRVVTGGQIGTLQKLFPEIRAARGAFALMTAGGTVYSRVMGEMGDKTQILGATQRAFNEQMQGLGMQFQVFKNQVTAAGIAIGAALIPPLRQALQAAQDAGPRIGAALRSMGQAARPAFEAIGDAVQQVVRLFKTLIEAVGPVVRTMAGMTFAAAIAGLTGLARALAMVAGFLADHPALVTALAVAYGAVLVGRILTAAAAFIKLQAGMVALRLGLFGLVEGTLMANLAMLATRLAGVGAAFGVFLTGNFAGAGLAFAASIRGIGTALAALAPTLAGAALIGGFFALTSAMENSRKKAQALVTELKDQFDLETLAGLKGFVAASQDQLTTLDTEFENMVGSGSSLGTAVRRLVEDFSPLPNKMSENVAATNALQAEMDRARTKSMMWDHDLNTLSNTLGMSRGQVQAWLDELGNYDPTDTAQTTGFLADEIRTMALEAAHATPATEAMSNAIETMGDPTATAADRIGQLKDTIDALIGTMLGVFDAETAFAQAMRDLNDAVAENTFTLDLNSEAGLKVREAFSGAASAAIDHANAVAAESGSVAEGVDVLKKHREELINQVAGYVGSREAAEQYVNQLGLTPETISTLVQLGGMEESLFSMEQFQQMARLIDAVKMNPRVNIDSEQFDNDAIKIGTVLAQIGMAEPEAEVLLNGEKFTPTAEMVQAWALTWDNSSPEAKAILNIIDPENKFASLSQAAQFWEDEEATATASVDNNPAKLKLAEAKDHLFDWEASTGTATANTNNADALNKIRQAKDRLFDWNVSKGTGRALGNNADAVNKIAAAAGKLGAWDRSSGTASVNAKDNASNIISNVGRLLAGLHDKTVTVTTHFVQEGAPGPQIRRMGGIEHAQQGLLQAGVVNQPAVLFGERATGGEAFIPRHGNFNRSRMVLAQAADWYGMQMVPQGGVNRAQVNDMRTIVNVSVNAASIMDGRTLVQAIKDNVGAEIADHDRRLLRSLKSR